MNRNKEWLSGISEHTQAAERAVIEAAHIYADRQPSLEQQRSAVLATNLQASLGIPMFRMLLIDDYNIVQQTLNIGSYLVWLTRYGYVPDEVILESELVPAAQELLQEIRDVLPPKKLHTPKNRSGGSNLALGLWASSGQFVHLLTSDGRPSCALLDAALYKRKAQLAPISLTVLPSEYTAQQAATHAILYKINKKVSVVNVYIPSSDKDDYVVSYTNNHE